MMAIAFYGSHHFFFYLKPYVEEYYKSELSFYKLLYRLDISGFIIFNQFEIRSYVDVFAGNIPC